MRNDLLRPLLAVLITCAIGAFFAVFVWGWWYEAVTASDLPDILKQFLLFR